MIWAIAIRNLWQHKTKTLIIGALVTIGIMLTFAGNAFIDSMIRNISDIFTNYYTGDILVTSSETMGAGVFGAQSDDTVGFPVIPVLKGIDRVEDKIKTMPGVKSVTRQLSGYAMINFDDSGFDYGLFFGIEPDSYFPVMNGLEIVDGRKLKEGEEGVLLSYNQWKSFKEQKNIVLHVGDLMQLNSFGTNGIKIREVPIVGIYKFPRGNERMFPMSFIDAKSLRYILGRSGGVAEKVEVPAAATALLDSSADMDSLFTDSAIVAPAATPSKKSVTDTLAILGDSKHAVPQAPQEQSWHFLLVRLQKGTDAAPLIKNLNGWIDENDILARAQGWWVSAMPDSLTYSGIQILFNVAIFILGFVSIIIIMNTLVVSVMERTSEIGTMRALGAQKSFVTRMFIAETGFITLVFGILGLLLGALIILVLNIVGIPTDNDALRYLGGGGILRPTISSVPVVTSLVLMGLIALLSWIYPVLIALKVSPLKAITTE